MTQDFVDGDPEQLDELAHFQRASFSVDLPLPPAPRQLLKEAGAAIRKEYQDSAKWKRLNCRNVTTLSKSNSGTLFELEIGHGVEFDWTWEGAVAFRPLLLREFEDSAATAFVNGSIDPDIDDSILWSGEVLEVDEATGRVFIVVSDPEHVPCRGSFYVRPFEFLTFLDSIYNEGVFSEIRRRSLASRLAAARGGIHPAIAGVKTAPVGLEQLRSWWSRSWSVLWGPPGTGKTYTTGRQVAQVLADDPSERILVVSTTNRATDAVAVAVGRAVEAAAKETGLAAARSADTQPAATREDQSRERPSPFRRIGKGASLKTFQQAGLDHMLRGTETEYLAQSEELAAELARTESPATRALLRQQMKELREAMRDASLRNFLDADVRAVICTSFKANTLLCYEEVSSDIEEERAPFTTVIIDEAGLISRVAVAALSLLAARRVVLVGDSKQLAPISRISRIIDPLQGNWLAMSGLSHLDQITQRIDGVHVLSEQRRMQEQVCNVVSAYQYDGFLTTAPEVGERPFDMPTILKGQPRAIWYVLDEDTDDIASIRADRGPGNRSWIRRSTIDLLHKLFADPTLRDAEGLFISPFKAQAKLVHSFFASHKMKSWMASTVHSQQGSEADVVIFDSVNAGSCGWPYDEWKRLVNVAISRSRESLIFLASRAEMEEPYLRPLLRHLAPQVLESGLERRWKTVPIRGEFRLPNQWAKAREEERIDDGDLRLGRQLAERKALRPVLSHEQERLCGFELDGKPRLVRGVAGSGKTLVLAHWLMQTVRRFEQQPHVRIWAVFANRSLQSLIGDSIESAWSEATGGLSFPWNRVQLHHIKDILAVLLPEVELTASDYGFAYDEAAAAYLKRHGTQDIKPRCDALFIDEAQDMGPSTLRLLAAIVRQHDTADDNSRAVNIFYDNAQNIYGRGTPKWAEFGLDMRGRSSVMKESFRSTHPITEFALNVLYRLQPPESNPDHKELLARGLIERIERDGTDWWRVRFNQIDGPNPQYRPFADIDEEIRAIADYCRDLIVQQNVQPSDICLVYNGPDIRDRLTEHVGPALADLGVELSVQTNKPFQLSPNMLLATTSHSFKGYDAEVVIIPGVDQYVAHGKGVLANNLYVAMTRARSVLTLFGQKRRFPDSERLHEVITTCLSTLEQRPAIDSESGVQDDLLAILDRLGAGHRRWLVDIWKRYVITQEPLTDSRGEIVAEPLFQFQVGARHYACFDSAPQRASQLRRLAEYNVQIVQPGEVIPVGEE